MWTNRGLECYNRSICDGYPPPGLGPAPCVHSDAEETGEAGSLEKVYGLHPDTNFFSGMNWGGGTASTFNKHRLTCRLIDNIDVNIILLSSGPSTFFSPIFIRTGVCNNNAFIPCVGVVPTRQTCDDLVTPGGNYVGIEAQSYNFVWLVLNGKASNTTHLVSRPDLPLMEQAVISAKNKALDKLKFFNFFVSNSPFVRTNFFQLDHVGRATSGEAANGKIDQWARGWDSAGLQSFEIPDAYTYAGRLRNSGAEVVVKHMITKVNIGMRMQAQMVDEYQEGAIPAPEIRDAMYKIYPHARVRIEIKTAMRVELKNKGVIPSYTKSWLPRDHAEYNRVIKLELVHADANLEIGTFVQEINGDPTEIVEVIDVYDPDTGVVFPLDRITQVDWWGYRGEANKTAPIGKLSSTLSTLCDQLRNSLSPFVIPGWPYEQGRYEAGLIPSAATVYGGSLVLDFDTP